MSRTSQSATPRVRRVRPTFAQVFRKNLKRVLTHWTPFTVTLVFLGTFLGSVSLYIYTRAIGRADLFMSALDSKSSLAAWMFVVVAVMFSHLIILMGSSWLYGTAVSLFGRVRWLTRHVALWLVIPLAVGYAAFIVLGFFYHRMLSPGVAMLLISAATLLAFAALFFSRSFRSLFVLAVPKNKGKADRWFLGMFLSFTLVFAVIASSLSMLLIIDTYVGRDNEAAVSFVAGFSLFTLLMSLLPSMLYFVFKGDIYRKVAAGIGGALLFFVIFLTTAKGAMSSITYSVAGSLEVRQGFSQRYVFDRQVTLADIDPLLWHSRLRHDGKVQVRAYQLFAFGDLLLLCPHSLLGAKLHQLPDYTRLCIFTRSSQVERLPPLLLPIVQREPQRAQWQEAADRQMGWEQIRGQMLQDKR
ncbi:hypothetical protein [Pseudomonas putida]|uniref:hypothetical protein n=1 Tax=Pseudomonas putida TaxID=303 RepID=UPI0018D8E117|nr:hypothetical protein [Pseudomonas putida]MBH3460361.1 hypothetical protein [Pseudomonas putida]